MMTLPHNLGGASANDVYIWVPIARLADTRGGGGPRHGTPWPPPGAARRDPAGRVAGLQGSGTVGAARAGEAIRSGLPGLAIRLRADRAAAAVSTLP